MKADRFEGVRQIGIVLALLGVIAPPVIAATPGPPVTAKDFAQGAVWDLRVLFADQAAAQSELAAIEAAVPSVADYKGRLGESAATLNDALDQRSALLHRGRRLYEYAFLKVSEDSRVSSSQAFQGSAGALVAKLKAATAFFDPEIVAIGRGKLDAFLAQNRDLGRHRRELMLIMRQADHTLSPDAEMVLAASGALRRAPSTTHDVFSNGELPWPTITIHGNPVRIDQAAYRELMRDPDRETRRVAYEAYTAALGQFRNTQAALLQAHVGGAAFEAKLRHYPSSAAFILADDAMPPGAFGAMSEAADAEQPAINRYLRLRAKAMGLSILHSYDYAVPLAATQDRHTLAEGEALVLKALAPLGSDYTSRLGAAFQAQRMHAIAAPGKDPGSMTIPFYDGVPAMVMITYTGDAESDSILAHEWGHAMHMDMAGAAHSAETANPSVFIMDTPSLVNEMLLDDYRIGHAASRAEKIAALSQAVETLRRTYYGVLPLMRVEMAERAAADHGDTLSADRLSGMTCDALRVFNGADRGVSVLDPGECATWTVSAQPYDNLYFYKYLNAVSAAAYFAAAIERGDHGVREQYFDLLRAGGSDDPYVLLKRAGFVAEDPAAYAAMGRRFERDIDLLEAELKAQAQSAN